MALRNLFASKAAPPKARYEVDQSEGEWMQQLGPERYQVLRRHATERPFTSPLNAEKRPGRFCCAGCGRELFATEAKFDSGTGWPSFFRPIDGAVGTAEDSSLWMTRTEVHCGRCGGHLGHIFEDGPAPTGQRYCINGAALAFKPDGAKGE